MTSIECLSTIVTLITLTAFTYLPSVDLPPTYSQGVTNNSNGGTLDISCVRCENTKAVTASVRLASGDTPKAIAEKIVSALEVKPKAPGILYPHESVIHVGMDDGVDLYMTASTDSAYKHYPPVASVKVTDLGNLNVKIDWKHQKTERPGKLLIRSIEGFTFAQEIDGTKSSETISLSNHNWPDFADKSYLTIQIYALSGGLPCTPSTPITATIER